MIGLVVTEFIRKLGNNPRLPKYDQNFLESFRAKFSTVDPASKLNAAQVQWILDIYAKRWNDIVDIDDYTLNQEGSNACWIEFAHILAGHCGKTYLGVLMPTVANTVDPNNFTVLADCKDLNVFFLGDDEKTLYSLLGLRDNLQLSRSLVTHNVGKSDTERSPRPISISEWFRIKAKRRPVPFELSGESPYSGFNDCLMRKVIPEWHKSGELPRHLLPSLVELIDLYFAEKNIDASQRTFPKKLFAWTRSLQECSVDDAYCLYGQTIRDGEKYLYLINALTVCLQGEYTAIRSKVLGIARWLGKYDSSMVCKSLELSGLYHSIGIGPAFRYRELQHHLETMCAHSSAKIQSAIKQLLVLLQQKKAIDGRVMLELSDIYHKRWLEIKGTKDDYTQSQVGHNANWINLAQLLSGAGYIEINYYCFLMPTLSDDFDLVSKQPLSHYPLSHYVLSEDGEQLINLNHCERHFKLLGTFYNCNLGPTQPLTDTEIRRLHYANSRFRKYITHTKCISDSDPPISRATVNALYTLVNNSLFVRGLYFAHTYDDTQLTAAENAYHTFNEYFHNQLTSTEKDRLLAQHVPFQGEMVTLQALFEKMEKVQKVKDDGCIAGCAFSIARLVMDYAPHMKFNDNIEVEASVSKMRAHARKKVLSNYQSIDDKEAQRRIQILAASLMTYNFQQWFGDSVSIWDCPNSLAPVPKDVYRLIMPMVSSGDYTYARHLYATIMESVILPAHTARSSSLIRSSCTSQWVESVASGSLFAQNKSWYKPELLLATLLSVTLSDPMGARYLRLFLEDFINTYAQPHTNTALKEIRVNIKFFQLLDRLERVSIILRTRILTALESPRKQIDVGEFCMMYANFLVSRLAALSSGSIAYQQMGIFSPTIRRNPGIEETLSSVVCSEHKSTQLVIEQLQSKVKAIPGSDCTESSRAVMLRYLDQVVRPIISQVPSIPWLGPQVSPMVSAH